jgi:serine/threonine protein kinase
VRPFGRTTPQDIYSEMAAVETIRAGRDHKNLIKFIRHGQLESFYYFDMEFCDFNLEDYIYDRTELSVIESIRMTFCLLLDSRDWDPQTAQGLPYGVRIFEQITKGLKHLHEMDLTHRDVKPRNSTIFNIVTDIQVLFSMADGHWKIADFGITKYGLEHSELITIHAKGTACYRAPELLRKSATYTHKVDKWALGCILHELLVGHMAFRDDYDAQRYTNDSFDFSDLQLPVNQRTKYLLLALVKSLLNVDWWKRPSTQDILNLLSEIDRPGGTNVRLYNCSHAPASRRPTPAEGIFVAIAGMSQICTLGVGMLQRVSRL